MKKLFLMLLCGALMASFTACNENEPENGSNSTENNGTNAGSQLGPNEHYYVDLGLPSGLLWATCNVGATKPEEYGDYFAWGETSPKSEYSWDTYKYGTYDETDKTDYGLTKYNETDGKTILESADDAATANWGSAWHMPTKSDLYELFNYCECSLILLNQVYGYRFTGPNGNSIFLPAAGRYEGTNLEYVGKCGYYWTSWLYTIEIEYPDHIQDAYSLGFGVDFSGTYEPKRCYGIPVRPVCSPAK